MSTNHGPLDVNSLLELLIEVDGVQFVVQRNIETCVAVASIPQYVLPQSAPQSMNKYGIIVSRPVVKSRSSAQPQKAVADSVTGQALGGEQNNKCRRRQDKLAGSNDLTNLK